MAERLMLERKLTAERKTPNDWPENTSDTAVTMTESLPSVRQSAGRKLGKALEGWRHVRVEARTFQEGV